MRNNKENNKMKKLLVMAAVVASTIAANAASFKWTAGNMYASNGKDKWTGTVSLYGYLASAGASTAVLVDTATANSSGTVSNKTFDWAAAESDKKYNFYYIIEDSGKVFTSATKEDIIAQASASATIGFGNQSTATQAAGAWVAVPEPTSGLLMLLGLAGLALKRKRA